MKRVEVEVTILVEIPDALEERLRGGPSGADDNADAYTDVATGIKERRFPVLMAEVDSIQPAGEHWRLQ